MLGIRLQLVLLLECLGLCAEALQRDVVAVEASDLLDVDLLVVRPSSILCAAHRLHIGQLSEQAGILLRLWLLVLLLLQNEGSVQLLRLLGAIATSLLEQVPWRELQLTGGLLRLHQMALELVLAVDGGLLVALGLHRILCTRQVLLVLDHARDALWLALSTTEDHLLGGLRADLGRDVLAHRVRIEGLRLLILSNQVDALVVLLDTVDVLEVAVLDGSLVAADSSLRLL